MTEQEYIKQAPTATIFDGLIKAKSVLNSHNNIMVSISGGNRRIHCCRPKFG